MFLSIKSWTENADIRRLIMFGFSLFDKQCFN